MCEHYVFHELQSWIDYRSPTSRLTYWRSKSGYEVDFLIDDTWAVEVKATRLSQERDLRGLKALREEGIVRRFTLVCREPRPRLVDGIEIMPIDLFLKELWNKSLRP